MTQGTELATPSGGLSRQTAALAGPPPLITGESAAGYDELLARVCETLRPSDALEHIWTRDIVDLAWEVFRLRRLKAGLMAAAAHKGVAQVLAPLTDYPKEIAESWAKRHVPAVQTVAAELADAGLTMDAVAACTFSARIGEFERIERMMMAAEARRNAALHELERHRRSASFARRLHGALEVVEEAAREVMAPAAPAPEAAA